MHSKFLDRVPGMVFTDPREEECSSGHKWSESRPLSCIVSSWPSCNAPGTYSTYIIISCPDFP